LAFALCGRIAMLIDNENYLDPIVVEKILELWGWKFLSAKIKEGILLFKADFYDTGFILAERRNAVIKCEGETRFLINGKVYNSISEAIEINGDKILKDINSWEWKIEKEWQVEKKNGDFVTTFSTLSQCPKKVR
jgi:hypothetical protein